MSLADYPALFQKSFAELQDFHRKWRPRIESRCPEDSQQEAAFDVWDRYSVSIRSIERLIDPSLLPDVCVLCRCCLEFDVTLEAVMLDVKYADAYREFEKHGIARYLKVLNTPDDADKYRKYKAEFEERFEESPDKFKLDSWCRDFRGITGLMRDPLKRIDDIKGYNLLCNYVHPSVLAMRTLQGKINDPRISLASAIRSTYCGYLDSTRKFVTFIWESTNTPEGEECKSDILRILRRHVEEAK